MLLQMWTLKKPHLTLLYNKLEQLEIHQRPDDKLLGIIQGCNTALINSQQFIIWSTMPTIYCLPTMKINSGGKNTGHQVEVKTGLSFHHPCCLSEEDWGKMKLNQTKKAEPERQNPWQQTKHTKTTF